MRLRDAFPSKFLKADDVGHASFTAEIEAVTLEHIGDDDRLVASFVGKGKRLPLNRVNAATIAEIAGSDDTDHWAGTCVRLFTVPVLFQGKTVRALRVGPVNPPAPPKTADHDDIGF